MSISGIAIRRPVFTWMLMAALILFGALSLHGLGISQMPDVNFPVVNVRLQLDNAAPEVMEGDVVDPVEDAIMGVEGLRAVFSRSYQGTADISCEFELGRDVDSAMQDVQTRIAQAARRLPSKLRPPVVTKTNPEDEPLLWVLLSADEHVPDFQRMIYARHTIKDRLSTVPGVGDIVLAGYVEPNLRVWIDGKKMWNEELTSSDVIAAIQSEQLERPAGRLENASKETNVRLLGESRTLEDFSKIRVQTRGGTANFQPSLLGGFARLETGIADRRSISRHQGKPVIGLGVVKQHGANAFAVAQGIRQRVEETRKAMLPGYDLAVRFDSTRFIHDSVDELKHTLVLAALLTSIVCFLFLGTWSTTINVLLAIPTSVLGAFIALRAFGFTLNTFTLLGLSLAIGVVVDDAIMILDNIIRHREKGKDRMTAALDGSSEITFAAIATSAAIAAIFIPVVFMKGVVGKAFFQYGITVTVTVALSLLEALTLTPMRCARFMKDGATQASNALTRAVDRAMARLSALYLAQLPRVLARRKQTLGFSLVLFLVSLVALASLRKELVPAQDQSYFLVTLKTAPGTAIEATDQVMRSAEELVRGLPGVREIYTTIGGSANGDLVNSGTVFVLLDEPGRRPRQSELIAKARQDLGRLLPGTEVLAQDPSLAGFSASKGYPIEFVYEGAEPKALASKVEAFMKSLRETGLLLDVHSDSLGTVAELHVVPDRVRAAASGVSVKTMGQEVSAMIGGSVLDTGTQFPDREHRHDIRVRSIPEQHAAPEDLGKVLLRNNRGARGELVPLSAVARVEHAKAPLVITRYNRARAAIVRANLAPGASQEEAAERIQKLARALPAGERVLETGNLQAFHESFDGLLFALLLGLAVAYMVLASQFNSFIHPITVLMALPFSVSGAAIALKLGGQSLNLFSLIGLILLMGIAKKNSILLVDFAQQRRADGLSPDAALLEACPERLRPILMTSLATIAGALPAAFSIGPGAETRVPMGLAIVGGVTFSTLLVLFVVPCVYSLLARFERAAP